MLKKLCQCIGLASLILVMNYGDLLGGGYDVRMHVPFALGSIVAAQIADILLLGLLLFIVLTALSRTRLYPWTRLLLATIVPPYLLERLRFQIPFSMSSAVFWVLGILWAVVVVALLRRSPAKYRALLRLGDFVGIFLAVFALCSIVQMLLVVRWKPGPHERVAAWESTPQPPREHPLVVWILFDELSYDQVYAQRAPGLSLPAFDALRAQSTVFTDAQPIGEKTVKVIPSLLGGSTVQAYSFDFENRLRVRDAGANGYHLLNGAETVFADAQKEGWRTAAVGWYNPYCTIYAQAIDQCYWTNLDVIDGPMSQQVSLTKNALSPLKVLGEGLIAPAKADRDVCTYDVTQRTKTYVDLEQHSLALLRKDQADFVFLHLPVPHSPNIWNRNTGDFAKACGRSYLDNLALADRELGEMLQILQSSPRWKHTTVIVQGDHSWRIHLWNNLPGWTEEDRQATRAGFDPRPAVIIHQAGQESPEQNATPWSLLNVHSFVEQVIHGVPVQP
jgi:hypothetical protein